MSDFVQEHGLTHQSASATRLSATLARPRWVAAACLVALIAVGWIAIAMMTAGSPLAWRALCQPVLPGGAGELALAVPMWMSMTLVMMLPTAGPMILTYAEIADTAMRKREPVVSPLVLTTGYIVVWLGFAAVAASLQWLLARNGLLNDGSASRLIGGAIFVGAGLYQFSALKQACLTLCQRPFPFFFANWTTQCWGVLRLGLRQGMVCLGCCWAMMLVMFAVGTMNVIWMAALGALMTVEKLTTTLQFSQVVGVVFMAAGFGLIISSVV